MFKALKSFKTAAVFLEAKDRHNDSKVFCHAVVQDI